MAIRHSSPIRHGKITDKSRVNCIDHDQGWATTAAMCFAAGVSTILMGWLDKRYPYTFNYEGHREVVTSQLDAVDSKPDDAIEKEAHVQ